MASLGTVPAWPAWGRASKPACDRVLFTSTSLVPASLPRDESSLRPDAKGSSTALKPPRIIRVDGLGEPRPLFWISGLGDVQTHDRGQRRITADRPYHRGRYSCRPRAGHRRPSGHGPAAMSIHWVWCLYQPLKLGNSPYPGGGHGAGGSSNTSAAASAKRGVEASCPSARYRATRCWSLAGWALPSKAGSSTSNAGAMAAELKSFLLWSAASVYIEPARVSTAERLFCHRGGRRLRCWVMGGCQANRGPAPVDVPGRFSSTSRRHAHD